MISDTQWKTELNLMKTTYGIVRRAQGQTSTSPTLSRISQAFPLSIFALTHALKERINHVVNYFELGTKIPIDSKMNYVPSLINVSNGSSKALALFILNNLYQAQLTKKTSLSNKKVFIDQAFSGACLFQNCNGTVIFLKGQKAKFNEYIKSLAIQVKGNIIYCCEYKIKA